MTDYTECTCVSSVTAPCPFHFPRLTKLLATPSVFVEPPKSPTPTTDDVREAFNDASFGRRTETTAAFDRWLAAHDTEVRADEQRKIAEAIFNEEQRGMLAVSADPTNPQRNGFMLGLQRARDITAARGDGAE